MDLAIISIPNWEHPSQRPHTAEHLAPADLLHPGEVVRDLVAHLGYGIAAGLLEAALCREAINAALSMLSSRQAVRASFRERDEAQGFTAPELSPIALHHLAQDIISRSSSAGAMTLPSEREQRAHIHFALALDPTCCDAYIAEGEIEERVMALAIENLGPDAFEQAAQGMAHFWYSVRHAALHEHPRSTGFFALA